MIKPPIIFILMLVAFTHIGYSQERLALLHTDEVFSDYEYKDLTTIRSTSFELDGGMIIIEASFNGQKKAFILDTGAPSLILNNYDGVGKRTTLTGVAGESEAKAVEIEAFSWAGIQLEKVPALSVDMSHLEKTIGRRIGGLIGFDLIKNYELYIDYDRQLIQMRPNQHPAVNAKKPLASYPFEMQGHIPVIKAQIGHRILRLGLDTGAEVNVLNKSLKESLSKVLMNPTSNNQLLDLNNQFTQLEKAQIPTTKIATVKYHQMEYLFLDLDYINEDQSTKLDGILGFPFFSSCTVSINFETKRVYIWEVEK